MQLSGRKYVKYESNVTSIMMTGNFQKSKDSNNTFNYIKYILISVGITVHPEYHTRENIFQS